MTTDTKLNQIIAVQEEIFVRRQPGSKRLAEQAKATSQAVSPRAGRSPRRSRSG